MPIPKPEESGCLPVESIIDSLVTAQPIVLFDLLGILCSTLEGRRLISTRTFGTIMKLVRTSSLYRVIPQEDLVRRARESDQARERVERGMGLSDGQGSR